METMPAQMDEINRVQKKLYRELQAAEEGVHSLEETVAQVKALGHPAEEQEEHLEKMQQLLKKAKQRIEYLWEYSVPYGQA